MRSSSADHSFLLMIGSRWLCQRSRHCLPDRDGTPSAITDQFRVPCVSELRDRRVLRRPHAPVDARVLVDSASVVAVLDAV